MKHLATKREVAAYEHSVKGGLAAHAARLECLKAQLQQAGSFLDTLPQSRQELGAALAEMQQRNAASTVLLQCSSILQFHAAASML